MADALLRGVCVPSAVNSRLCSPVPFRHALHTHALNPRRRCRALRHSVARPTTVRAHATEAPAKSKARPGEKKGAQQMSCASSAWTTAFTCCVKTVCCPGKAGGFNSSDKCKLFDTLTCSAGFVEEMRFVAMKLHTKDQAPKEGGKEASPQPFQKVILHRNCVTA